MKASGAAGGGPVENILSCLTPAIISVLVLQAALYLHGPEGGFSFNVRSNYKHRGREQVASEGRKTGEHVK